MREAMFEELLVRYEQRLRRRTEAAAIQLDLDVSDEGHTTLSYAQLRTLAAASADDASAATVVEALRFLHENAFHPEAEETGNWWHWEIGTPRILLDICVLLRAHIPDADLKRYLATVQRFCPDPDRRVKTGPWSPLTETGANRADKALIVALAGLLAGDADRVALARDGLSSLFSYVASGDGFYEDGSFVQHDTVAYTGSYGVVLLTSVAEILALLRGSPWEVVDPGVSVVFDAVEKAFLPFLFEGRMMDAVRGRAIARQHSRDLDIGAATLDAIRLLAESAPASYAERWASLARPEGFHVFGSMDRVVHHRPRWSAALSLSSERIARYECGNGENLHGWYTGDGMLYIYDLADPDHYTDEFWATVDPYRLPGTTVDTRRREDVGRGSGRGTGAITAPNRIAGGTIVTGGFGTADLDLHGEGSTLRARKKWHFLDDAVMALGTDISASDGRRIETIVENRNLRSDAGRRFVVDGVAQAPGLGVERRHHGVQWAYLEGVGGYVFPGGADLMSLREERVGTWHAIDVGVGTEGDDVEIRRIFHTLWLDHGVSPRRAGYMYVLLPGASEEGTARRAAQL
ncbi:Hyaluronate lyase [Catenulispora acidiphila DSM 44928]|uniref:Hyaluronate lyase n=1 Tax=Catenulispora acidiphila (strain DSM 44928 / JCM 14897 / NBRC 102108 / NRRL B-24433 / ID139908) TaxID=479433 RepID=C7Q078_CATAD|nr:polysaccharide lyase 8 family protein [Catenulispora acidiphila]ACU75571.1 Hyaluronate lyase [Catenulispora acidiphila DSM 44928]